MKNNSYNEPNFYLIGRKIKKIRTSNGIDKQTMANEIGWTISYITRIENGNTKLDLETIYKIADFLKVSPEYLIRSEYENNQEYLKDLQDILEKCNPKQKKLIMTLSELVNQTNFDENKKE